MLVFKSVYVYLCSLLFNTVSLAHFINTNCISYVHDLMFAVLGF